MNKCSIAVLPERGLIELKGPDATTFLQGLITNDMGKVREGAALFAGLLSPQGKILFEFFVVAVADGCILDCQASQVADLVKRLGLYKLRAKLEIADRSAALSVAALWGASEAPGGAPEGGALSADPRLAGMGWRLIAPADIVREWAGQTGLREATAADYHQHRIGLLVPEGGADYAFADAYPHEACYDQLNGVDFKKGCYVGQEIVARMEFRKTARTRITGVVTLDGAQLPPQGAELMAGDAHIGTMGSSVGLRGLALVRVDRAGEAMEKGVIISANGVAVELRKPAWANYAGL